VPARLKKAWRPTGGVPPKDLSTRRNLGVGGNSGNVCPDPDSAFIALVGLPVTLPAQRTRFIPQHRRDFTLPSIMEELSLAEMPYDSCGVSRVDVEG